MSATKNADRNLRLISRGISARSDSVLTQCVTRVGIEGLDDPHLLDLARMRRLWPEVMLIATLNIENGFELQKSQDVQAVYSSVLGRKLTAEIDALGSKNPVHLMCRALIEEGECSFVDLIDSEISPHWLLALEMSIDFTRTDLLLKLVRIFVQKDPNSLEVLLAVRAVTDRLRFLPSFADIPSFIDALLLLEELYKKDALEFYLTKITCNLAEAYEMAGETDKALEYCHAIEGSELSAHASYLAGRISVRAGRLDDGCRYYGDFLSKLIDNSNSKELDATKQAEEKSETEDDKEFPADIAGQAMRDLNRVLAPLGIKPFLVSGTLLGYARNGGFLTHDKDVDVGIFGWDDQFQIFDLLMKSGLFSVSADSLRGKDGYVLSAIHVLNGMAIDIFFYHELAGNYVTGVTYTWGYTVNFEFSKFGLKEVDFCGAPAYVPDDIDKNMSENFGPGWRLPDPDYISHLESPSLCQKGEPVHFVVAYDKMAGAITKKNYDKARRIVRFMEQYPDNPLNFSPALKAKIFDWADAGMAKKAVESIEVAEHA